MDNRFAFCITRACNASTFHAYENEEDGKMKEKIPWKILFWKHWKNILYLFHSSVARVSIKHALFAGFMVCARCLARESYRGGVRGSGWERERRRENEWCCIIMNAAVTTVLILSPCTLHYRILVCDFCIYTPNIDACEQASSHIHTKTVYDANEWTDCVFMSRSLLFTTFFLFSTFCLRLSHSFTWP